MNNIVLTGMPGAGKSTIGVLLAKTRNEMGVTQTKLAKLAHMDQGDISKIEKGLGNPTIAKISKLFKALGKDVRLDLR